MKKCTEFDERLDALRAMGPRDYERRIRESLELQNDCLQAGCERHYVHAVLVEAHSYVYQGEYEQALQRLYEILPQAEQCGDDRALINTKKLMAESCFQMGNFTDALELFFEILPTAEQNEDKRLPATILLSIGRAYLVLDNEIDGLKYCRMALDLFNELNFTSGIYAATINIGIAHMQAENHDEAVEVFSGVVKQTDEESTAHQLAPALNLLGSLHTTRGAPQEAEPILQRALDLAVKINDRYTECDTLKYLTELELVQGRLNEATKYCRRCYEIAEQSKYRKLVCASHRLFTEIYEKQGDQAAALASFRKFHELERELLNADTQNISNSMRLRFENEKALRDAEIQRLRNVELVNLNNQLEEVNHDLASSNSQLNAMNQEKSLFMRTLKHDLLSPLKHVIFYAEELDDGFDRFSNTQMLDYIRNVKRQSADLHTMVDTLLSASLIELGEFTIEFEAVEPAAVVRECIARWQKTADEKRITIRETLNEDVRIRANRVHFRQIVDNLLSNAVKFSPFDGHISVSLELQRNSVVRLSVRDSGPGLTESDRTKLFQMFKRLSAAPTGGEKSHGIGLAFVHRIAGAMSGRVWCESEAGNGALFVVELPQA